MTSKERVLTAFSNQQPDRVPIDYSANPGIDGRLKRHYGLAADDNAGLCSALGVDFRGIMPAYTGPPLHQEPPGIKINLWGAHCRWIEHETGGYWDYCDFPLQNATLKEMLEWPMFRHDAQHTGCYNCNEIIVEERLQSKVVNNEKENIK